MKLGELFNSQTPLAGMKVEVRQKGMWNASVQSFLVRIALHLPSLLWSQTCIWRARSIYSCLHFPKACQARAARVQLDRNFKNALLRWAAFLGQCPRICSRQPQIAYALSRGFECFCFFTACNLDTICIHTYYIYIYISNLHTVSCCAFTILEYLSGAPAHSVGTYTIETRNRNCASHCPQCERLWKTKLHCGRQLGRDRVAFCFGMQFQTKLQSAHAAANKTRVTCAIWTHVNIHYDWIQWNTYIYIYATVFTSQVWIWSAFAWHLAMSLGCPRHRQEAQITHREVFKSLMSLMVVHRIWELPWGPNSPTQDPPMQLARGDE